MNQGPIETAEKELKKTAKRASKMLRAARKGGRGASGMAAAGAALLADVLEQRVVRARDVYYGQLVQEVLAQLAPVLAQAYERKIKAVPVLVPNPPGNAQLDLSHLSRDLQIYFEIQRLSAERAKAEPSAKAEIEIRLNELRDEFLAIRRAGAEPHPKNYSSELYRRAVDRLADVLLDLELNAGPSEKLEAERDRLGELLQRLAELRGMDELKTAMGPAVAA